MDRIGMLLDRVRERLGPRWREDLREATRTGLLAGAAIAALAIPLAWPWLTSRPQAPVAPAPVVATPVPDFAGETVSDDTRRVVQWIAGSGDNAGLDFVIIDKKAAQLYVFDARARLSGTSAILIGAAIGDDSVPGIGDRPIDQVRPEERTTPAGRFFSRPGRNASGEDVIWVDYAAAVSMHRVRLTDPRERRMERLASPEVAAKRISYGCINVPARFYDDQLKPRFMARGAYVYVLPEVKALEQVFAVDSAQMARGS
jgi:hypothetical protein